MDTASNNTVSSSSNVKVFLLVLAFVIVGGTLWYTHEIVLALQAKQKNIANLYAKSFEYLGSGKTPDGDYSFVLDNIIRNIDFPIIFTDANHEPLHPYSKNIRNVELDTTLSLEQQRLFLKRLLIEIDELNPPIKVQYESAILNYVHFGESTLITKLRLLPYIELSMVAVFILIAYISFSYIKRNEQSNIWVGMARETAHQLGTPISSMMGWIELLKHQSGNSNPHITETLRDMDNDVQRLQKIADRFSKIGSKPDLHDENLAEVIEKVILYFQRRIPQTGKKVRLLLESSDVIYAHINRELFEWVIENLVKNALDAIDSGEGKITITVGERAEYTYIDVTDTGKGIDPTHKKDVFRPGFSTKKRGWGLGLSLSQRIIESYHKGKLSLKESKPGVGTTFRIKLKD